jgi:hypothetical protein
MIALSYMILLTLLTIIFISVPLIIYFRNRHITGGGGGGGGNTNCPNLEQEKINGNCVDKCKNYQKRCGIKCIDKEDNCINDSACPIEKSCNNNTACCSDWRKICNPVNGTECIDDTNTCKKCTNSNQCSNGKFCCPFMRLCVYEDTPCPNTWAANCSPRCDDFMDQTKCTCSNPDFPNNWK